MLTHKSLQTFIEISKHVSFSKKLNHIIIATNVYQEIPLRFRDDDAAASYVRGYEEQKSLLSTGSDREMLTEAFQRLENLKTVGIRDFNAANRVRDGKSWTSWGATTVYCETGISLQFSDRDHYSPEVGSRFLSRVFSSVVYALGKADRHPPIIEVLLRQHGLPDTAFFLPEFILPAVEPVLQNLTSLLLNVDLLLRYHTHSSGTSADPHAGRSLRHFLGRTPNLTHLRLNFEKHMVAANQAFLEWLSEPVSTARADDFLNPPPVTFPLLKQLEIGQLTVHADLLVAVVTKFAPRLEDLSLWRMNLHSLAPPPFGHKPNLWRDLCSRLEKIPQINLTHLKIGMLQQDHMLVYFKEDDQPEGAKPTPLKEYTGKEMSKFWEEIQEQVSVTWPDPALVNEADSDEDEDEDEEMADEDEEEEEDEDDDE
jgi:hypothetical protein